VTSLQERAVLAKTTRRHAHRGPPALGAACSSARSTVFSREWLCHAESPQAPWRDHRARPELERRRAMTRGRARSRSSRPGTSCTASGRRPAGEAGRVASLDRWRWRAARRSSFTALSRGGRTMTAAEYPRGTVNRRTLARRGSLTPAARSTVHLHARGVLIRLFSCSAVCFAGVLRSISRDAGAGANGRNIARPAPLGEFRPGSRSPGRPGPRRPRSTTPGPARVWSRSRRARTRT
jgi:hypothetical protein